MIVLRVAEGHQVAAVRIFVCEGGGEQRDRTERKAYCSFTFTDRVWVAEKRRVWRERGKLSTMALTVFSNPMSRMRSASSSTNVTRACVSELHHEANDWRRRIIPRS